MEKKVTPGKNVKDKHAIQQRVLLERIKRTLSVLWISGAMKEGTNCKEEILKNIKISQDTVKKEMVEGCSVSLCFSCIH